ncbi:hypothetical protein B0H16DRAFT_1782753 [Mycena metata]|uniref:Uncharacterized protein n=1 Tax=Mycena metata TaxID=1033252 RepID=A0AAD7MMW7_9AGAR|nr:hypothetical protein B0H16DRAFT_1782753 [Mycena metata]
MLKSLLLLLIWALILSMQVFDVKLHVERAALCDVDCEHQQVLQEKAEPALPVLPSCSETRGAGMSGWRAVPHALPGFLGGSFDLPDHNLSRRRRMLERWDENHALLPTPIARRLMFQPVFGVLGPLLLLQIDTCWHSKRNVTQGAKCGALAITATVWHPTRTCTALAWDFHGNPTAFAADLTGSCSFDPTWVRGTCLKKSGTLPFGNSTMFNAVSKIIVTFEVICDSMVEHSFPHVRTLAVHIAQFPVAGTVSTKMVINAETQDIIGVLVEMPAVQALGGKFIQAMFNHVVKVELVSPFNSLFSKCCHPLHKIHAFVEAQQSGSKVKKFFRQGELSILLKECKIRTAIDVLADVKEMQDETHLRHQEVLNIIEAMSNSDSASLISHMYSGSYTRWYQALTHFSHAHSNLSSNSIYMLPAEPKIFHGRDSELAHILKSFEQGTPRIAILGAGGMGKTSLARIALHHEQITTKDQGNRFFVACDTASSRAELAGLIGGHLGMKPGKDLTQAVTMRGAERPAKVRWTQPFLLPLRPLSQDAAQKMFIEIADDSLLAHVVDMEGCSHILSRWKTEKTSLISEGYDKKSNLELSISLSLSSPRIASMPHAQDLLALLSMLPDGLSDVEFKQAKFPIKDILNCRAALLRTALAYTDDSKRVKVLVPVREYMEKFFPPTDQMIKPLFNHFHELVETYMTAFGKESAAFHRISSNYTNIQNVLRYNLRSEHSDLGNAIYCTCDFNRFSKRSGHGATPLLEDITSLLPSIDDHRLRVISISELLPLSRTHSISHPEMLIAQGLDHLEHFDDPKIKSRFHSCLGFYYSEQIRDIPKAIEHCPTSLFLAQVNGDYRGQCIVLNTLSWIEWLGGNYTAGQVYAQEMQKLAKISGDFFQEARGLYSEALCCQDLGDYRYCISLFTKSRTFLGLCGMAMAHVDLNSHIMNSKADLYTCKSEYAEAHSIQSQILQEALEDHNIYRQGFALVNIVEIEVAMGSHKDEIQKKIDASKIIFERLGILRVLMAIECAQGDLNLREGDLSSLLFCGMDHPTPPHGQQSFLHIPSRESKS